MAKLDEVLDAARAIVGHSDANRYSTGYILAKDIVDLLGEDPPCGFEPPEPVPMDDGSTSLYVQMQLRSKAEARAYAAMILRAADEQWPD